jgi:hypothetical protein
MDLINDLMMMPLMPHDATDAIMMMPLMPLVEASGMRCIKPSTATVKGQRPQSKSSPPHRPTTVDTLLHSPSRPTSWANTKLPLCPLLSSGDSVAVLSAACSAAGRSKLSSGA